MPLVALEGIDKSGKDTQARILEKKFVSMNIDVKCVAFPDYETPIGKEINRFLQGKLNLRPEVRQLLYVANRWERQRDIDEWLRRKTIVIADRYIPSGLAYGLANGLNLNWMLNLEKGLPVADVVILIDISPETSYGRDRKKDIYEKDLVFLEKVRSSYHELAKRFNRTIINGEVGVRKVSQEIWKSIQTSIKIE